MHNANEKITIRMTEETSKKVKDVVKPTMYQQDEDEEIVKAPKAETNQAPVPLPKAKLPDVNELRYCTN